jgi:hypothetical protein
LFYNSQAVFVLNNFLTCIDLFDIFDNVGINRKDIKVSGLGDLGQGQIVNANLVNNVDSVAGLYGGDSLTILSAKKACFVPK